MRTGAGRLLIATGLALASWSCFVALDFAGYDTDPPAPREAEGGVVVFDGSLQGDFQLTATPRALTLISGGPSAQIEIGVVAGTGFAATVALTASGAPVGVRVDAQGVVIPAGVTSARIAVAADLTAPPGRHTVTIRAQAGTLSHDVTIEITIRGAPGALDTSFGDGGIVTTALGGTAIFGDMVIQSDDGVVIGGGVEDGGAPSFALARYDRDGHLDNGFGNQGVVTTRPPASTMAAVIKGLVGLPNAQIVAAGGESGEVVLVRYLANGALDPTFGKQGMVTLGGDFMFAAVLRRPSGALVVAGTLSSSTKALLQFQPNGATDLTFADAGVAEHVDPGSLNGAALAPDGTIVIIGGERSRCATAAFGADGTSSSSSSFGRTQCDPQRVAVDDKGFRALVGSARGPQSRTDLVVDLELSDGSPSMTSPEPFRVIGGDANGLTFDAAGRILLAEVTTSAGASAFGVRRLRRDLTPDLTFSASGLMTANIGESATAGRVRLQSDGRIVVGGTTKTGLQSSFAIARYWP